METYKVRIFFFRYIHIKDPLQYTEWLTRKSVPISILVIWVTSALISFLPISLGLHAPLSSQSKRQLKRCVFAEKRQNLMTVKNKKTLHIFFFFQLKHHQWQYHKWYLLSTTRWRGKSIWRKKFGKCVSSQLTLIKIINGILEIIDVHTITYDNQHALLDIETTNDIVVLERLSAYTMTW